MHVCAVCLLCLCSRYEYSSLIDFERWKPAPSLVKSVKGHEGPVFDTDVSVNGDYLVSGSQDKTVRLWANVTGKHIRTFEGHSGWVKGVAFSPVIDTHPKYEPALVPLPSPLCPCTYPLAPLPSQGTRGSPEHRIRLHRQHAPHLAYRHW